MMQVSLLGEQVISDAAGTTRTRSSRTVALVGFLVIHAGMPQARHRLATTFWPDSSDAQALTNLRRELHHLRIALGDSDSLLITGKDLCWQDSAACIVDVRVFEHERKLALAASAAGDHERALTHADIAVKQYRGEFLPGSYDDWLLEARSELEDQCVRLLDLIAQARTIGGELSAAMDSIRQRIELRPLEEVGYRTLMHLQGELGDRGGAVSTYHRCAAVLERELGVEPDPETRALLDRLLSRERKAVLATREAQSRARRSGNDSAELIGRSAQLGVLTTTWHAAAAGRLSVALVRGDPGVGKTRLVTELAALARSNGAVVASARCFGSSGRLALAPVGDWLREAAIAAGIATLEPVWRLEVERLIPSENSRTDPASNPAAASLDAWQRHRFFEGLARALINVGRPTLLVLDNVQWCDPETLAFITFFLGLSAKAPLMLAATLRNDDGSQDPGLAEWIARIRATGTATDVVLNPLEVGDTARLAEAISGRPLTELEADLFQATTGGFPLYVVEAARSIADLGSSVPAGNLTAVLGNRLDQLSPTARDIAGLASAVGRNFTLDLLTEASDLDADSVVSAVDELWRHRIVRAIGDGYDFSHDLLRESAYLQISPPRRWLLHRRIAQGLELLHADDPDSVAAELAEQFLRGGRSDRAVGYFQRAASIATGMFAHDEAIRLHRETLAILATQPDGHGRARRELAVLEAIAAPLNARFGYSSAQLQRTQERAFALAEQLGIRESILSGLVGLWTCQFVQGNATAALQTATKALTLVVPDSPHSGAAHFAFGGSTVSVGRPAEGIRHLEHASTLQSTLPLSVGTRPDVHSRAFAAHAHWLLGDEDQALRSCAEAIALARTIDSPYNLAVALAYAGILHQMRGDATELSSTVLELRGLCDRYEFAYYREWVRVLDGWSRTGESGIDLLQQGINNLRADGSFARMPYWLTLLAGAFAGLGRRDAARATLDAALVRAHASDDLWWLPEVLRMRADHDDDDASAIQRLRGAADLAAEQGSVALHGRCATDLLARGVRVTPMTVRANPDN